MTEKDPLQTPDVEKPSSPSQKKSDEDPSTREPLDVSHPDIEQSLAPPSYQMLDRGSDGDDDDRIAKICRICLEDDHPQDMIAPCKCRGGSKWVHRQCLDQWRIHETDRAFSKCTECLFDYYLQPVPSSRFVSPAMRRRVKYMFMVSRDLCIATVTVQIIIAVLGLIVYWMDPDQNLPLYINPDYPVATYYLFGVVGLLMLLGIGGLIMLCNHGCDVEDSIEAIPVVRMGPEYRQPSYEQRSGHYQSRRRQRQQNRRRGNPQQQQEDRGRRNDEEDCCVNCCLYTYYYPSPYYYGDPGPCYYCCCCCRDNEDPRAGPHRQATSTDLNHAAAGGCDCCGPDGGNGGGGDCGEACLVFLVVFAVFLAMVGFVVGIIILVVIFQRTVQRHIYILHKRQLATEFQVMDLAGYDLDRPLAPEHPLPSAPLLPEQDSVYLKTLGLKV